MRFGRESNAVEQDTGPPRELLFHENAENDVTQRHLAASAYYLLDRPARYLVPLEVCAALGQAHALAALAHIEAEKMEKGRLGR